MVNQINKWEDFLDPIFKKNGFRVFRSKNINDTKEVIYKPSSENPDLEIKVGYLKKDLLIYLTVFDPKVPGYNLHLEGEYFNKYDFYEDKSYGEPGLEFEKENIKGIKNFLRDGLRGREIQYLKDNQILKSKVYLVEEGVSIPYYFYKRSFWEIIFRSKIENKDGIEIKEIDLNEIFSGFKDLV